VFEHFLGSGDLKSSVIIKPFSTSFFPHLGSRTKIKGC